MRSTLAVFASLALAGAAAAQETDKTALKWGTLDEAKKAGKPVVFLRILGELEDKL